MGSEPKFVTITDELAKVIGKPDRGTRIFRAEGTGEDFMRWWDTLVEHFPRGLVSPGGGCQYAGVSRAAIHRAIREGRLTVFAYHSWKEQRGIFGSKIVRENPYQYVPVIELKAWRMELEERIGQMRESGATLIKIRNIIHRELEGEKPDYHAWFMLKHPEGRVVRKKQKG
jgi:hypothetical protein